MMSSDICKVKLDQMKKKLETNSENWILKLKTKKNNLKKDVLLWMLDLLLDCFIKQSLLIQ